MKTGICFYKKIPLIFNAVCPRSSASFCIESDYTKLVTVLVGHTVDIYFQNASNVKKLALNKRKKAYTKIVSL